MIINKFNVPLVIMMLALLLFVSCRPDKKKDTPIADPQLQAPNFSADSAFNFVKAQTDFGPRVPNSQAHAQCADYLIQQLAQYCDTTMVQSFQSKTYNGTTLNGKNLIGSFAPENSKRIILAAHWDSRHVADYDPDVNKRKTPIDGANDGASGVGVLLEIARQLSQKAPNIGVDIIFFDLEDYGAPDNENAPDGDWWGLGSQYWSNHPHVANYQADYGILLDMVGDANATFRYESFSSRYAQDILAKVWATAYQLGFYNYFIAQPSNAITDDHYYVNTIANIPMIDIIHQDDYTGTGFTATWHTTNDNITHINKNTLAVVGKTVLSVIYSEK